MQSGLTVKWQKESKFYFNLEHALKSRHHYHEIRVKINLQHLEMAFYILILGNVLGIGVFVMEILWKKKRI